MGNKSGMTYELTKKEKKDCNLNAWMNWKRRTAILMLGKKLFHFLVIDHLSHIPTS